MRGLVLQVHYSVENCPNNQNITDKHLIWENDLLYMDDHKQIALKKIKHKFNFKDKWNRPVY